MQDTTERKDVYSRITAQIVEHLEKGVRPWIRPWNAEHAAGRITRPLRHNGQPYSGINVLSLWMSALGQNFAAPIWMTFRQASELNAHVRKGEKGSLVVYANAITRTEHDDKDRRGYRARNPLHERLYRVQRRADRRPAGNLLRESDPYPRSRGAHRTCREVFRQPWEQRSSMAEIAPTTRRNSTTCRCRPLKPSAMLKSTTPLLPMKCTHWTKHPQRLDRDFGRKSYGDEGYSREELVAELGSAFLCADLELHQEPREDNAAYIATWLEVLKNDNRAIFTAAAHAQRAADYLNQMPPRRSRRPARLNPDRPLSLCARRPTGDCSPTRNAKAAEHSAKGSGVSQSFPQSSTG